MWRTHDAVVCDSRHAGRAGAAPLRAAAARAAAGRPRGGTRREAVVDDQDHPAAQRNPFPASSITFDPALQLSVAAALGTAALRPRLLPRAAPGVADSARPAVNGKRFGRPLKGHTKYVTCLAWEPLIAHADKVPGFDYKHPEVLFSLLLWLHFGVIAFSERAPQLTQERREELADIAAPAVGVAGALGVLRLQAVANWLLGRA